MQLFRQLDNWPIKVSIIWKKMETFRNSMNGLQSRLKVHRKTAVNDIESGPSQSQDGGIPECNISALLKSQPGCHANASQSTEFVQKNHTQALSVCNIPVPF
jgi:hypothetical protein